MAVLSKRPNPKAESRCATRTRWGTGVTLTACAVLMAASAWTGQAAAAVSIGQWSGGQSTGPEPAGMTVAQILQANPRAREIQPNVVEIDTGVAVLVPPSLGRSGVGLAYTDGRASCNTQWICMWENSFGQNLGYGLAFTACQGANDSYDLQSYRYPDGAMVGHGSGARWNDRISSYANKQTSGTHSWFANWVGSQLRVVKDSYAPDHSEDLNALGLNDMIDAVHSCTG